MKNFKCKYCKCTDYYLEKKAQHIGLYCADCGRWSKWVKQSEIDNIELYKK